MTRKPQSYLRFDRIVIDDPKLFYSELIDAIRRYEQENGEKSDFTTCPTVTRKHAETGEENNDEKPLAATAQRLFHEYTSLVRSPNMQDRRVDTMPSSASSKVAKNSLLQRGSCRTGETIFSTTGISPPATVTLHGRSLIPPQSSFARAVVMGNEMSAAEQKQPKPRISNLTAALMNQSEEPLPQNEADSASGPPPASPTATHALGSSAPQHILSRQNSTSAVSVGGARAMSDRVPRCLSSKELGTIAPPSGSPYAYMLLKKEQLESSMRLRLQTMREAAGHPRAECSDESSSTSSRRKEGANESRNRRRAQHTQAVIADLCNVVADLFLAESKLLKPLNYGVPSTNDMEEGRDFHREETVRCIHNFVSALPTRYALGAESPSEVLLHMRLMAAARADKYKAVVHIHNLAEHEAWSRTTASVNPDKLLRLVTISCNDAVGLLEYITKLLATGGSRVLDADVMLSTDGIVLDRFIVEMNGRLRLDRLANLIEAFLRGKDAEGDRVASSQSSQASSSSSPPKQNGGPLYYRSVVPPEVSTPLSIQEEMQTAIPLTEVLASSSDLLHVPGLPKLRRMHSMPDASARSPVLPNVQLSRRKGSMDGVSLANSSPDRAEVGVIVGESTGDNAPAKASFATRQRRPLVNRRASSNLDDFETQDAEQVSLDYMTVPHSEYDNNSGSEGRNIPIIPFDELMLIETLGTGRVSTIYRAAWQRGVFAPSSPAGVQMVALKVAMINNITGDTAHVDELRREADIAARLSHPNICDLVGVAADQDCFCLAYDFCEGGSLLSLLSDSSRYYEYLPIALDIANGMAYLHSRNVIHRDLKPSNILLSRDHRAKIADFGMSVTNTGQELTAETGTYRYMSPEVIRHESYSSNADVYSFGICLWQLITREIPFATMTPIQAAYAVAEGRRPPIPPSTPRRLQEIIMSCWDQDSHKRPSFTYIALALADYAKMAFSPANVGAQTLQIANEMLSNVEGNSTVNVDFSTPVAAEAFSSYAYPISSNDSIHSNSDVGLEIE